jgi:DNA excision repair protein ERCC-8
MCSLVSGGSDGSIRLWDLEQAGNPAASHTYKPIAQIGRSGQEESSVGSSRATSSRAGPPPRPGTHRFGITHLSFYPFDSAAFLSTSYDQTLKVWSTETASLSGSFSLGATCYTHAISPIASHLLVACGTQFPAVRLVDLRSSASIQSLVAPGGAGGEAGAVLSVAWSPRHEHVLASGSVDGAVRIWDIRKANGLVSLLDKEDSLGITHMGRSARPERGDGGTEADASLNALRERGIRASAKAHAGPVNSHTWTDDGAFIISAGHDRRIRVWDAATGANTLVNFGPTVQNSQASTVHMFTSPTGLTQPGGELLLWPNETEILLCDLHSGEIVTRLRPVGQALVDPLSSRGKNRVTSVVWRAAGGVSGSMGVVMGGRNAPGGIYSGHLDGQIRAWLPAVEGLEDEGEWGAEEVTETAAPRKRKALDDVVRSLTGRQIRYS